MHILKYLSFLRSRLFYKKIWNMSFMEKTCFVEGKKKISIGNNPKIMSGIRMEAIDDGKIVIGNNCMIEQNIHIISKGSKLIIEDNTHISANVFISNVDHKYDDIRKSVMDQQLLLRETYVGNGCFIGCGAVLLPGTKLGNYCYVDSKTVLKGKYSDNSIIVGVPGKVIKL